MYNYKKTQYSPSDATKLAIFFLLRREDEIISNFGQTFEKIGFFDDILHFND